jgi:hypothetical protein
MLDAAAPSPGIVRADETAADFFVGGSDGDVRGRVETRSPGDAAAPAPRADRLMVHRGQLTVAVARPDDAITKLLAQVEAWGGYLGQRQDQSVTVRVPAARFAEAVALVRGLGPLRREQIEALDVTEEHRDLGIRLDNARRSRDRLLALLEKASAVEDLLKIEQELCWFTTEIERMEGELKALNDRVALATLTVTFEAIAPARGRIAPRSRFQWINSVGVEHVRNR